MAFDFSKLQAIMELLAAAQKAGLLGDAGAPAVAPALPISVPVAPQPTAPVASDHGPMGVQLGVTSVRRQGVLVTAEVMAPGGVLMAHDKVFLDSSEVYEDGTPVADEDKQPPEDIRHECFYGDGDKPDLVVKGDEFRRGLEGNDQKGAHFLVSHQGLEKLRVSSGHSLILKLQEGDPGTSNWHVVSYHDRVASNPVGGRAD